MSGKSCFACQPAGRGSCDARHTRRPLPLNCVLMWDRRPQLGPGIAGLSPSIGGERRASGVRRRASALLSTRVPSRIAHSGRIWLRSDRGPSKRLASRDRSRGTRPGRSPDAQRPAPTERRHEQPVDRDQGRQHLRAEDRDQRGPGGAYGQKGPRVRVRKIVR